MQTPITIINGPIGSGKTSLIHALLKKRADNKNILWLKTEFGDTSVDQYFLEDTGVQTKDLAGGCICHVLLSEFNTVLDTVKDKGLSEIIVETSGMSHPAPVILNIQNHDSFFIKHIALIVDAQNVNAQNYPKPMPLPYGSPLPYQSIVFNKYPKNLSISEEGALEKLLDPWYQGLYDTIEKFIIENDYENIDVTTWAKFIEKSKENTISISKETNIHQFEDHEGENVETKTIIISKGKIIDKNLLENIIKSTPENIIRIKGVFKTDAQEFSGFNWARGNGNWNALTQKPEKLVLLVMGYDLQKAEDFLQNLEKLFVE